MEFFWSWDCYSCGIARSSVEVSIKEMSSNALARSFWKKVEDFVWEI